MGRRRATSVAAAILLGVVPALVPTPAFALVKGEVAFQCHARMPEWPGFGNGVCDHGLIDDMAEVEAQGVTDGGAPFLVAGAADQMTVFTYDTECVAGEPSLLGTAVGTSVVSGLPAFTTGPTTAQLVLNWSATVVGTDITITITGGQFQFSNGDTASITRGLGQGQMFPLINASNRCPNGGPMDALVQGEVDLLL